MSHGSKRRTFLKGIGAAAVFGAVSTRTTSATPAEDRFIVDAETVSMDEMSGMEVVYDFRAEIGYVVVEGDEDAMPDTASYAPDLDIEIEVPKQKGMATDAREAEANEEPFIDLQWDKTEQNIESVHEDTTGDGARIGIIDDGVLGAGDRDIVGGLDSHPDLPNVRPDLSRNFSGDGNGPGPLNDDHGTHCAGTAAAAANGFGVVGIAPDAEIVDLRVFSGLGATFGDIAAAIIYGSTGTDEGGAGCEVLNLSLSTPPLLPVDKPSDEIGSEDDPDGDGPIIPVNAAVLAVLVAFNDALGEFATANGTLPVASAGNDGIDLDRQYETAFDGKIGGVDFDGSPVNLPCEGEGFMSIGAAGPIGFGWPLGPGRSETVAGLSIEDPANPELPTEEPAFYTNYGVDAVDVTAGGGNADLDAIAESADDDDEAPLWFIDLVFNTGIANLDPNAPEDTVLDTYVPGYAFKAGTSFSAPNVAGLAGLLFAVRDDPDPSDVRSAIEDTARPLPVGRAGETTAPGAEVNVATDGNGDTFLATGSVETENFIFDGDKPSNPGSAPGPFGSETYRGEGHIDVSRAVARLSEDDEDGEEDEKKEEEESEDDEGRGNGRGRGN